jgi:hypothetical protein
MQNCKNSPQIKGWQHQLCLIEPTVHHIVLEKLRSSGLRDRRYMHYGGQTRENDKQQPIKMLLTSPHQSDCSNKGKDVGRVERN